MSKANWGEFAPYNPPKEDYIDQEMEKFEQLVEDFCSTAGVDKDRVEVNVQTLQDIILRVDMRKLYFRIFHADMNPNEYKQVIGLTGFWILKLRPFWVRVNEDDSDKILQLSMWINEKVVLHMVCGLLKQFNPEFFLSGQDLCESYCTELLYSFRYRDLSKESMFLLFDPFYFLALRNESGREGKILL